MRISIKTLKLLVKSEQVNRSIYDYLLPRPQFPIHCKVNSTTGGIHITWHEGRIDKNGVFHPFPYTNKVGRFGNVYEKMPVD